MPQLSVKSQCCWAVIGAGAAGAEDERIICCETLKLWFCQVKPIFNVLSRHRDDNAIKYRLVTVCKIIALSIRFFHPLICVSSETLKCNKVIRKITADKMMIIRKQWRFRWFGERNCNHYWIFPMIEYKSCATIMKYLDEVHDAYISVREKGLMVATRWWSAIFLGTTFTYQFIDEQSRPRTWPESILVLLSLMVFIWYSVLNKLQYTESKWDSGGKRHWRNGRQEAEKMPKAESPNGDNRAD